MRRYEALRALLAALDPEDLAVFSTGLIGREAFHAGDRPTSFYMMGSMGLASSLGLGLALSTDRRVVVVEGDGSALMDLGSLAMVAAERPRRFTHVVLDNASYESTGGQPAASAVADLAAVARAAGYARVAAVDDAGSLAREMAAARREPGPHFLRVRVAAGRRDGVPRVGVSPPDLVRRLRGVLA